MELVRLRPEHMKAVHDLYPASDIECREVFEKLVAELPAYGIFVEGSYLVILALKGSDDVILLTQLGLREIQ